MQGKPRSVVIGGGGGLGVAICRALAENGMQVVLADLDGARAQEIAEALRAEELDVLAEQCDAASSADVGALAGRLEAGGLVDAVVAMAGVVRNDLLVKVKDSDFDLTIATHLKGTLNALRAFLPAMRKRGYGRFVTMSSIAARGSMGGASYSAAKAGIEGLTRTAAIEMAKSGVTVNCVAPGLVNAGMFLTVPEDYQKTSLASVPMGRAAEPAEIADCVRFLASREASYVTGQTLNICGGLSIGPL
ncbi:MAG: SDR family oxidoreductase [Sphingomonadales bacterium]|nr:MAG: SDR family oxidoreductase [Sphingomonadales bacterium]